MLRPTLKSLHWTAASACCRLRCHVSATRSLSSIAPRQPTPQTHSAPVVLSGIQPTGTPHLGNYLGAVRQWAQLQHTHPTVLYSIVDLHALTAHPPVAPHELRQSIRDTAALLLASGIDPHKSALFQQSHVPAHANLAWVLTCLSSAGWLARMTQWKAKAGGSLAPDAGVPPTLKMGLFSYPVLMAADILVYQATHIPVGDDQLQHLELTRLIAKTFNSAYKTDLFPMPQAITLSSGKRIMSLTDPTSKMSKSAPSSASRILLTDSNDAIVKKIRRAVTDSDPTITYDPEHRPGVSNLLSLYAACHDIADPATVVASGGALAGVQGHANLKAKVAEAVVGVVEPIRTEYVRILADTAHVDSVLEDGAQRANVRADKVYSQVRKVIGVM